MTNKKKKEQIIYSLSEIISEIEKRTKEYLEEFDMNAAFCFSDDEESRKNHLLSYNKFSTDLNVHIEKAEQKIALISALICTTDNECDKDLTEDLVGHFNRYVQFSVSVSNFVESSKKAFQSRESSFRPTAAVSHARDLLAAIQNYKKNI